ncbi:Synovial apoptosis inhibitor 1 synoviolin [Paragonimus skrjabini miyazakii]|uniref:Synovial apoptosis inhibitor 1 synoviolin n=1 Tax=Paragonimus skrjabini miyazakii TaxID=59628 RepID=A0A8S9YLR1_9TREM|nr:Synovial apoptosis inhibitor 1 synoviolin [Paragonimus skrjabini miyazakii]
MRYSTAVVVSSFLLTSLVIWSAYNRKKQFYPTVVYVTNNQPCVTVLLFQCAVLLFMFAKVANSLFFGRLQQAEVDNLVSQAWYSFFDMCLVFAFFQDELGTEFLFLFSILLLVRAFHWLIEERVEYMERTPVLNELFHVRVLSLIFILGVVDVYYLRNAYWKPTTPGQTAHLAVGVEYVNLLVSLFSITVRYIIHSIDSMRDHPWDKKPMYLLYLDIVVGFFRLLIYVDFTVLICVRHPFPLFVARPIYLSVRSLKKAIRDVLMSRRAIRYMNTVFSDASSADLAASSDTVCIICREEMQLPASGGPSNQNTVLKRLPCSHIFHPPGIQLPFIPPYWGSQAQSGLTIPQSIPASSSMPPFPPLPFPLVTPPFFGMPVVYPGSLLPNAMSPMPEPPSGSPNSTSEAQLRASAEARFTALRQVNVLLNAAVLQMNAYLSAVSQPPDSITSGLSAFNSTTLAAAVSVNSDVITSVASDCTTANNGPLSDTKVNETIESKPGEPASRALTENCSDSEDPHLTEIRKRRLERFSTQTNGDDSKTD